MKNLFIAAGCFFSAYSGYAQPLFTYGNNVTNKEEFLRAYNKNKPVTADKEKSIREYLTLYTNFKLKVKAAKELRLDTLSQLKYDVQNFRDQIADNYLNDEPLLQKLVKEAADRSAKNIHILYFSVPVAEKATAADTLRAYNASKELYKQLKTGGTNYAEIVTNISGKIAPANYSDAGYITAFSLPYAFENIIYNMPVGSVSEPFKNKKGYGIFKVIDLRTDVGKWKVAQILFAYPPNADYNTKLEIKSKADSVYNLLKHGLSFADAAKTYSDDKMSYTGGGELPEFTTGKYNNTFEHNVFSLKTDSSISKPFETDFGYHIVKRLSNTGLPGNANAADFLVEIKQKVQLDPRINTVKEKFVKDITVKTGFKKFPGLSDVQLVKYADSLLKNQTLESDKFSPVSNKIIFTFKDGTTVEGKQWLQFVKDNSINVDVKNSDNTTLLKLFSAQSILNYYKKNLEQYNADFKFQMQEFVEGNMLFEIMERNVWSKAGADSVNLLNYYKANKEKYKWKESADVIIFNCTNELVANDVMASLKNGDQWKPLAEKSNSQIQADSGRYEIEQLPAPHVGTEVFSPIVKSTDGTAAVVRFIKVYPVNEQRNFLEARGLVINDYQNILEQKWVDSLRKKYPVKLNEAVVKSIL